MMTVSVELKSFNRAVEDLRSAVRSLHGRYGDVPAVSRLRNDLERLEIDVRDLNGLPARPSTAAIVEMQQLTDEPYDSAMWAEDADDEGLGGYRGTSR